MSGRSTTHFIAVKRDIGYYTILYFLPSSGVCWITLCWLIESAETAAFFLNQIYVLADIL